MKEQIENKEKDSIEPIRIGEERWPEFRSVIRKKYPEVKDADLPYEPVVDDGYFNRMKRFFGQSKTEFRKTISPFYTWKA